MAHLRVCQVMAKDEVIPPSNTLHCKAVSLDCALVILKAADKYRLSIPPVRMAEGVAQVEPFPESSSEGLRA